MGGRGKTPVVAHLTRLLVEAGHRPAILSRGYKRRRPEDGVVIVSDGVRMCADLDRAGDEPFLLARLVPGAAVLVCDVRATAAAVAEQVLGATVHLLDDGFQHTAMARDLDLVVITPGDLGDRRLPFGRLRSPVSALARADAVLIDGAGAAAVAPALARVIDPAHTELFTLHRRLTAAWWLEGGGEAGRRGGGETRRLEGGETGRLEGAEAGRLEGAEAGRLGGREAGRLEGGEAGRLGGDEPVIAVAGIAAPERFTRALESAGWRVARTIGFADHHPYGRRDLARITVAAEAAGVRTVLTTEKDAMRLLPLRPLPFRAAAVPLEVTPEPWDRFQDWVRARLAAVRAGAAAS
jgi:tetraacyldisaccharide 4'-kinase